MPPFWIGNASDTALLLGLLAMRVAVAFLLVPLFTQDLLPAIIRNALFLALALLALLLQRPLSLPQSAAAWLQAYAGEALIGLALGFGYAGLMWSFEMAGQLIDNKIGSSQAQLTDPLTGHQTSLNGAFLARLASWVFMASGGFMLFAATLLDSFALWPVGQPWHWLPSGAALFEIEGGRWLRSALMLAAPALLMLYLVDAVLGLTNRFAQQLNVFSLSMSLKSIVGQLVLLLQLGSLVSLLNQDLLARPARVLDWLRQLLG